jgi:hypothetical protein
MPEFWNPTGYSAANEASALHELQGGAVSEQAGSLRRHCGVT